MLGFLVSLALFCTQLVITGFFLAIGFNGGKAFLDWFKEWRLVRRELKLAREGG